MKEIFARRAAPKWIALALASVLALSGCGGAAPLSQAASSAPRAAASAPAGSAPAPVQSPASESGQAAAGSGAAQSTASEADSASDALLSQQELLQASLKTWQGWERLDADTLSNWLDTLGYDRTPDDKYPDVTMEALQGTWTDTAQETTLTIAGDLCTVDYPGIGITGQTAPCVLVNRSADQKCPMLVLLLYTEEPHEGLVYYISQVKDGKFRCYAQNEVFVRQ